MKNILIVEDNERTIRMLANAIMDNIGGVAVHLARDYETAVKEAFLRNIDVFVIDIILAPASAGDTSGIRFASLIRGNRNYLFTPMIFITALSDPELYTYRELHSFGYLEKPFSLPKALQLVKDALEYQSPVKEDDCIYLRKQGILFAVRIREIVYAEVQSHVLHIRLQDDVLEIPYMTIKKMMHLTQGRGFLQCSRNAIVNKKFIRNIDTINRYISLNGTEEVVEIGPAYKNKIFQEIANV